MTQGRGGKTLLTTELGVVEEIVREKPRVQELIVTTEAGKEKAINYPQMLGQLKLGERVLLNTTAVRAKLGTGGYHFVMNREGEEAKPEQVGHIVKLRYTPLQFRCSTIEEQGSPYREAIERCEGLEGMPVIVAGLHSQIAPAAGAVKALNPEARIAYIMTDEAALPYSFSKLAASLQEAGLIDVSLTVGQAFGADYEAVNLYSALLGAKAAFGADLVIVSQGPGNVGTETEWGFGSLAQADHLNTVNALQGDSIAVPRISFADPRPRHRGVSRHTLVVLGKAVLAQVKVSVPSMAPERLELVHRQLDDERITEWHEVLLAEGQVGVEELAKRGVEVISMGRAPAEDQEFFWAAGAAGVVAVRGSA